MLKYLVVGTGGTGGTLGAYLARAGKDVTFIARGEHLKAMKEKGLRIVGPDHEFRIAPVRAMELKDYNEKTDVIFVCVKGYSLDAVIPELKRIADANTVIIPILNIFGTGGRMQEYFPETLVTDGCIYVAAQIDKPGCILMNGNILRVIFGVRDQKDYREVLKDIESDLKESGITGVLSDNIQRDALLKFSYVSAQGACGVYYNVPAGPIQRPGEIRDCFAGLVHEIDLIAQAMGIRFGEDIVKRNLDILDDLSPEATTSMQRDIAGGRESEIDGLIFRVTELADRYAVDVPIYKKIAGELRSVSPGR